MEGAPEGLCMHGAQAGGDEFRLESVEGQIVHGAGHSGESGPELVSRKGGILSASPWLADGIESGILDQQSSIQAFDALLGQGEPALALAPMQDVTDLPFWRLMAEYGGADLYYTEYFRVHRDSHLEKWILESLTQNPTGRPAIAQMIGNDIPSLVRTARELQQYPIAAIDLNLGCPAPIVYRKCAGGGLLREPNRVDSILGALRDAISTKFTVKTRLGFDSPRVFDEFLGIFARHSL